MTGAISRRPGRVAAALALVVLVATMGAARTATSGRAAAATTNWPGGTWQPDQPTYSMTVIHDVAVKMDDGATLYADVGYPADKTTGRRASGTFPVLLMQNPYSPIPAPDAYFVSRGYIFVVADVRGTGRSEAPAGGSLTFSLFDPRQATDGVELVKWAAHELSGSNGVVGLTGCSYLGIDQLFTAAAAGAHSPIAAILPACAWNGYEVYFSGGIPTSIAGLFASAGSIVGTKYLAENEAAGKQLSDDILAGGPSAYDGAYWQQRSTLPAIPQIVHNGIPALLWSGWRATELSGVLDEYATFQNTFDGRTPTAPMTSSQPVTGRYQVVVGAGDHGSGLDSALELEWFDRWLKHETNGMDATSTPIHLYEMPGGPWVNAARYPIAPSSTPYYLSSGGSLSTAKPADGSDTVAYGPPTSPGTSVAYTTAAFDNAVTFAGPVTTSVWASSSNTNLELVITLSDLAPDGTANTITHGALVGSLRATDAAATWMGPNGVVVKAVHPYAQDVYLNPGQLARFDVSLLPTAWTLPAGHKLRVVVATQASTSDCAISITNGLPQAWPCLYTAPQKQSLPGGIYTIHYGAPNASLVGLPIVAAGTLTPSRSGVTASSNKASVPLDWGVLTSASAKGSSSEPNSTPSAWIWLAVVLGVVLACAGLYGWRRRRPGNS
jgi:uncharacterized protein